MANVTTLSKQFTKLVPDTKHEGISVIGERPLSQKKKTPAIRLALVAFLFVIFGH